jgi:aspartyl-tRNA(Asn)/glutamyl-tRNA(Gln) amidotransferase subunit C
VSGTFTRDDVERIARLARIELTEDEKALVTPQLSNFLAYAVQVHEIATSGVPPTSHPLGTTGAGREDTPQPSLPRADVLAQAPEADPSAGLFKVPRVIG